MSENKTRHSFGPSPLSKVVANITKPVFRKRGFAEGRIIADWEAIVGKDLAAASYPHKLVFPAGKRNSGTLHISVIGSFALELQHMEPVIIDKISAYFGYLAVARIRLSQKSQNEKNPSHEADIKIKSGSISDATRKDLQNNLRGIKDPELHSALYKMGELLKGK